jgi:hypothetical protein
MNNYYNKYLKYKNKYINKKNNQVGGKNNDSIFKKYIIKINNAIKNFIHNKNDKPIYSINSLKINLDYDDKDDIYNENCHMGQRKLLLTEIEFYNKFINLNDDNNIIIYAGSASCEHLPVILELFPKLKFLLIDPNYHSIDGEFKYVYQNIDVISKSNHRHFMDTLKYKNNERAKHLNKTTTKLLNTKFIYDKDNDYNILELENDKNKRKMKEFKKIFYYDNNINIFDTLVHLQERILIIQDYMDIKLTTYLKKYIDEAENKLNIYFLTDIRTTLIPKLGASDIDILYNSALQIIYLKELQPIYSMLKFRTPFFMNYNSVKKIYDNKYKNYEFIKEVFYYVKKNYGIDIMDKFVNDKQYLYFDYNHIFVQPWAPTSSTETRLFVSKKSIIKNFIKYDNIEWENKFFYFKFIRMFKYYNIFYEKIKNNTKLHYDGCQDCTRELMILLDYIQYKNNNIQSKKYNFKELSNLLNNKKNIDKLIELYELINKYVFYDLSIKNYKCPRIKNYPKKGYKKIISHNHHKKYRNNIIFYDKNLHSYLINKDNDIEIKNSLIL